MFSMMVCGILMKNLSLFAPFYFYSVIGVVWYFCWLWLVFEKPSLHTCIEPKELIMIEKSLGKAYFNCEINQIGSATKLSGFETWQLFLGSSQQHYTNPTLSSTPWKAFFTSLPCYAIFVANFCRSWNFYLLVLFQASYFKEAFGTSTAEVLWHFHKFSFDLKRFFVAECFFRSPAPFLNDVGGTCRWNYG